MTAQVLMIDGIVLKAEPKNGANFSLEEAQQIVGGYVEVLPLSKSQIMILNEEGKLLGLGFNHNATLAARMAGYDEVIVGDVLVCNTEMFK